MRRLIRLRRPPVVRVAEEPFVPRVDLAEVERRWAELRAANPALFDGRVLHVFGVFRNGHGGATLHVAECAYRHWAVGLHGFDTGARALGVKAIVLAGDRVLLGQRSERVAAYPGCWEFAPGGGVEPGSDPRRMIERELREESGLRLETRDRVSVRAVLFDGSVRSWEIVFLIRLHAPPPTLAPSDEYRSLRWAPLAEFACSANGPLTACAAAMLELLPGGAAQAVSTTGIDHVGTSTEEGRDAALGTA